MRKIFLFLLILLVAAVASVFSGCGGGSGPVFNPVNGGIHNDGRVANYTLLYPDRICRWEDSSFPIKVYIDPAPEAGGYETFIYQAALQGIQMWNGVMEDIPEVFIHEPVFAEADIIGRWEYMKLDGYTLAKDYEYWIMIRKFAINRRIMDTETVRLMVAHELGHVLGLNESNVSGDLMFTRVFPDKTSITQRDRDMINWLYTRENFIPIRPR